MVANNIDSSIKQPVSFQPPQATPTQSIETRPHVVVDGYDGTQRANTPVSPQVPVDPPTLSARLRPAILRAVARVSAIFVDPETRRPTTVGRAVVVVSTAVAAGAAAVAFVHGAPLFMGVGLAISAGMGALWIAGWAAGAIRRAYLEHKRAASEAAAQPPVAEQESTTPAEPESAQPEPDVLAPKNVGPHVPNLFAMDPLALDDNDSDDVDDSYMEPPTKRAKTEHASTPVRFPTPSANSVSTPVRAPLPGAKKLKID